MKHVIIGTAGHVDHGKTCLTRALTGVNTDRLKEEQERGITIENGYAKLELPNGQTASMIDVPGHERFVKNMIGGATGMDVVLMVIAADEGVMPQTREHLDILELLHVEKGIVVLTKCDLIDEEWLEIVQEETKEALKGSFLETAPMIPVSAQTGQGIDLLKQTIVELLDDTKPKRHDRPFRLPIDRVFSVSGFGTVVTGTLVDGTVKAGDEAVIYPLMKTVRIRELQNHDRKEEKVEAGMRVAMNLAGIEKKELKRGYTVAAPDSMTLTECMDVKIKITKDCEYLICNASRLHFYHGSQESICKIRLLDADELGPDEEGYAQLMFETPVAVRNGDTFIIRFFSPVITVGGGVILDSTAKRHRRKRKDVLERMERLGEQSPQERLMQIILDKKETLVTAGELAERENVSVEQIEKLLEELAGQKLIVDLNGKITAAATAEDIWDETEQLLKTYHKENPLKDGINQNELRSRIFKASKTDSDLLLRWYEEQGRIKISNGMVALSQFEIQFSPEQQQVKERLLKLYETAGCEAPDNKVIEEEFADERELYLQVSERLRYEGTLIGLTQQAAVLNRHYDTALETFCKLSENQSEIILAEFRTAMGFSRKYAQMYLEYWDKTAVTRRVGDAHILRKSK